MVKEVYFSVDIESDGPVPGPYSMSSLGCSVAGFRTSSGSKVDSTVRLDSDDPANSFYVEFKPISDDFIPEAAAVSGLDREELILNGEDPHVAMTNFCDWVNARVKSLGGNTAVFAAYPLGFDWLFTYWYIVNFSDTPSPFSHGRHIDIKTEFASRANFLISRSTKRGMPKSLFSDKPHTHNALDDAIEQGELLMNIFDFRGN